MSTKASIETINVIWDEQDECFIASIDGNDLIGCGDSEEEAIKHLHNHVLDEEETPRKRCKSAG